MCTFKTGIKLLESKTHSEACPYYGLSTTTTLGLIKSGLSLPLIRYFIILDASVLSDAAVRGSRLLHSPRLFSIRNRLQLRLYTNTFFCFVFLLARVYRSESMIWLTISWWNRAPKESRHYLLGSMYLKAIVSFSWLKNCSGNTKNLWSIHWYHFYANPSDDTIALSQQRTGTGFPTHSALYTKLKQNTATSFLLAGWSSNCNDDLLYCSYVEIFVYTYLYSIYSMYVHFVQWIIVLNLVNIIFRETSVILDCANIYLSPYKYAICCNHLYICTIV